MEFANEEKVTTQNEVEDCGSLATISSASQAAMQLRLMMDKVEGEDKCTLCKAAEELEKMALNQSNSWSSSWMLVLMLLMFDGFGNNKAYDLEALDAYMDVIKKKSQESDCKLQNES